MALTADEISPGVVAYLATTVLLPDARLQRRGRDQFRSGPFVCTAVSDGCTRWLEITTQPGRRDRPPRFHLHPDWLRYGSPRWRETPQFLNDVTEVFAGPAELFVAAAAACEPQRLPGPRPRVSWAGIIAIREELNWRKYLTSVALS